MTLCPKECETDRDNMKDNIRELYGLSLPAWVRGVLIAVIGVLFLLYGGLWIYNVSNFATKEDLHEAKVDLKEDITQGFKLIKAELQKGK